MGLRGFSIRRTFGIGGRRTKSRGESHHAAVKQSALDAQYADGSHWRRDGKSDDETFEKITHRPPEPSLRRPLLIASSR